MSSTLYREYEEDIDAEHFNIEIVQKEMLSNAKKHIGHLPYTEHLTKVFRANHGAFLATFLNVAEKHADETINLEILTEIQHYGGDTNLVDFTIDHFIALFFACDGHHDKDGRVILQKTEDIKDMIMSPRNPRHRIIAQKSVFVRPPKGFIKPHEDDIVTIPANLKPPLLQYLRKYHGISTETIYNDLHGFIRVQDLHQSAYTEFYKGSTYQNRKQYDKAIEHYTKAIDLKSDYVEAYNNRGNAHKARREYNRAIADYNKAIEIKPLTETYTNRGNAYSERGDFDRAIEEYKKAIELKPDFAGAYYSRGVTRLYLGEWEKAKADLTTAKEKGENIIASFHDTYESVSDFERKHGIQLPEDIAEMLSQNPENPKIQ